MLVGVESESDTHSRTQLNDAAAQPQIHHSGSWSSAHGQISA